MKQESTATRSAAPSVPMTAEQRAAFERDGYLLIRGALGPDEASAARVYAARTKAGSQGPDGSMHLLSAVANCPEVAGLIDHPATFGYVWSALGWNIHIYHSHLDVHPPIRVSMPFRFDWHQDGGRQNREIETTPRPRLSVKPHAALYGYALSPRRRTPLPGPQAPAPAPPRPAPAGPMHHAASRTVPTGPSASAHPRRPHQRIRASRVEAQVNTSSRVLEPHSSPEAA